MEPVRRVSGIVAPLDRVDVDTDQIIPKQFLKRIERTGYGEYLFYDWRFDEHGRKRDSFVLNRPPYDDARILVAGRNFGSGSSREHAVWALADFGIAAVVAPSFADIFFDNCFASGVVPVRLSDAEVGSLMTRAASGPYRAAVDLEEMSVIGEDGFRGVFTLPAHRRRSLLLGLDEVGLTLEREDAIAAYEEKVGLPSWSRTDEPT